MLNLVLNLIQYRFSIYFDFGPCNLIYPVRNNAPLLPPGQRPSGPAAAAGLDFRIIPAGFNAPLEFLTGFTAFVLVFIMLDIRIQLV